MRVTATRWNGAGGIGIAMLAMGFALGAGGAAAQQGRGDDEVPARVGRIADLGGEVYHAPEDRASDWSTIGINFPIASGDNLWVAEGGRAEIDVGAGQVRLGGATNVHVARLDDRTVALFVAQGRVMLRLRVLDPGEVARIDTPNTQVVLTRPGLYRIDVSEDRQRTSLVVREGEATLPTPVGMQQVLPGQTALVDGLDNPRIDVRVGLATDGFDTWSADRDRRYERSRSATYVSRQMVGYADLDEHGRWEDDSNYGAVWYPSLVDAGWAPYRNGYWTWVGAYGWTWVDYAPWGYAPFHYGRWVHNGGRWGWCPGAYVARPYWAPAMVGWVGGPGWGLSASLGGPVYGWVPLAWGEPYRPWWGGCGYNCWTHYNRPYSVRVDRRTHDAPPVQYVNANRPGGLTAVASTTFSGQKPVFRNLVPVSARDIASTPVLATAPVASRPGAGNIPLVKPGTANTPAPASASYAARRGADPIARPGTSLGGARAVSPSTAMPSSGRSAVPGAATPTYGAPAVTSVPGAGKPGSGNAVAPVTRDQRAPASSRDYPASLPAPAYVAPAGKPSPQAAPGVPPPTRYAAPVPRDNAPSHVPPQRGTSSPGYTAPVQRDTVQPYVPPQRAASAPQPSAPVSSLPMPATRVAPPQAPVVQHAPPPQPMVQQVAPAPAAQGGGRGARNDGGRDASQGGGNDAGGAGGGGDRGASGKPGPGR